MPTTHEAQSCPFPIQHYPTVQLAHGGGGSLMRQLIAKMFLPAFGNEILEQDHDGATFDVDGARLAFTNDSYVVNPLFFPGGSIGTLAINGTVNDLAMCGARPRFLSVSLIIEEGFSMDLLWRVVQEMKEAAAAAHVRLVTGDTKVVDRGKGDGLFLNTAGIGAVPAGIDVGPHRIVPGDAVVLSGDIGRHGITIMAMREGLEFESHIESDCAPVAEPVLALIDAGIEIHCMRDLTRGGMAGALVELSDTSGRGIQIEEAAIPVREDVHGACEMLGLDPLYVANEGRFVAFVPESHAARTLAIMRRHSASANAVRIGEVGETKSGGVMLRSRVGVDRLVTALSGEQLPRIC